MDLLNCISRAIVETVVNNYLEEYKEESSKVALGIFCTAYLDKNINLQRKKLRRYSATFKKMPSTYLNLDKSELEIKLKKNNLYYSITNSNIPDFKDSTHLGFWYSALAVSLLYLNSEKKQQ